MMMRYVAAVVRLPSLRDSCNVRGREGGREGKEQYESDEREHAQHLGGGRLPSLKSRLHEHC